MIREALADRVMEAHPQPRIQAIGAFSGGPGDVADNVDRAAEVAQRHAGIGLSLADASLIALAARLETDRVATFDERHFRAVEPLAGGAESFVVLPADTG